VKRSFQHTATSVNLLEVPPPRTGNGSSAAATAPELILDYFSRCVDTIGLPRSLAQLYATLFLSDEPLAFEEIVVRSGPSNASASTELRDLELLNGVERVMVANDRRSFQQAQLSLRPTAERLCCRIGGVWPQGRGPACLMTPWRSPRTVLTATILNPIAQSRRLARSGV
jgi:hypothetical protein